MDGTRWAEWARSARDDYLASLRHGRMPGGLDLGEVMAVLRGRLPEDAIVAGGAGNFSVRAHRCYQPGRRPRRLLSAESSVISP